MDKRIVVEVAAPADAVAIRSVQAETWLATYPNARRGITYEGVRQRIEGLNGEKIGPKIESLRQRIRTMDETHAIFVARLDGRVVGFTSPAILGGQRRLGALYVLPEAQGMGLGAQLIRRALRWHGAHDVYLRVAEYNHRAIEFYERFGFEPTGRRFADEEGRELGASIPELEMVRAGS